MAMRGNAKFDEALELLLADPPPEDPAAGLRELARADLGACRDMADRLILSVEDARDQLQLRLLDADPRLALAAALWAESEREGARRSGRASFPSVRVSATWVAPGEDRWGGVTYQGPIDDLGGAVGLSVDLRIQAGAFERIEERAVALLLDLVAETFDARELGMGPKDRERELPVQELYDAGVGAWAVWCWRDREWRQGALAPMRAIHEQAVLKASAGAAPAGPQGKPKPRL